MNLSGAMSNALSGLNAAGRVTETISQNVANAMTEGYSRRTVDLQSQTLGGTGQGVRVSGISRQTDPVLLADRRIAEATLSQSNLSANHLAAIEDAIGLPGETGALTERLAALDVALIEAASRPDTNARLQDVVHAGQAVAQSLNQISDTVQQERLRADQNIATAVEEINAALEQIANLNGIIARNRGPESTSAGLHDQRQQLIDQVAEHIPLREIARENGVVALYSTGGATLVDFEPAVLGFTQANVMTADLDVAMGTLSGLTINGNPVSVESNSGKVGGGALAAMFDIRDRQAPDVQTQLDAFARDLIGRFQDPAVDATLAPGDPGLFTDAGAAFDAVNETGIAGRVSFSAVVDPAQGGALWKLRDGLNATTPGAIGDSSLINAISDAFRDQRVPGSGGFAVARSSLGLASDILSVVSLRHQTAQTDVAFKRANVDGLVAAELRNGVDTDTEMQHLLLVEQAYAANARVISTIDDLMQTLLAI